MAPDLTAELFEKTERLLRRVSDSSLRRYAIMQSIFNKHKRKLDEDAAQKAPKKGVSTFSARLLLATQIDLMTKIIETQQGSLHG